MSVTILGIELCWELPFGRLAFSSKVNQMVLAAGLSSIEVYLVHDATMTIYNAKYMDCYGVTNILSFPMEDPHFSGSIILSVDTAKRESFLYQQSFDIYCLSLLSHGVGHLAGYEHSSEMDNFCKMLLKDIL